MLRKPRAAARQKRALRSAQPVYVLSFVNAIFEPGMDTFYHHYALVHSEDTGKVEGLAESKAKRLAEGLAQRIEKGKVVGIEEGERRKQREIVRKDIQKRLTVKEVFALAGLSEDEICML